jgi:transcriptional regulator with XRE-family HTH domain
VKDILKQPDIEKSFGRIIREKRAFRTFEDIKKRMRKNVQVTTSALWEYEKGKSFPRPEVLIDLCHIYGLSLKKMTKIIFNEKLNKKKQKFYKKKINKTKIAQNITLATAVEVFEKECNGNGVIVCENRTCTVYSLRTIKAVQVYKEREGI